MPNIVHALKNFISDRAYFRLLSRFALPIALQNLFSASLNMVAVMLVGQLGEASVAAVGLANQVWFLLNLIIFGVVSGAAMFVAQLWGKQDIANIRRVLGLTIKIGLFAALFFWILATFFPSSVLSLYTKDSEVILLGSQYLRLFGWSYGFFALTASYYVALRSTGNVRLPLVVSTATLGLNIILAYPLIFGIPSIGLPGMGILGTAIAGLIARVLECMVVLILVYRDKTNPVAASLHDIFEFDIKFLTSVMKPVLPVIANETLWSLGITTYNAIYGHIGTGAVAAINIVSTIDQMAFVVLLGIGNATAILVGNLIGQGEIEKAYRYAGRSLVMQITGGVFMGVLVFAFGDLVLRFYKVSPEVIQSAKSILNILAMAMWMRAANHVIVIGILRSGGDTRFSLILDGFVIWLVGVPAAAIGAFIFGLPIHLVYALTMTEEATKFIAGTWRYLSQEMDQRPYPESIGNPCRRSLTFSASRDRLLPLIQN